MISFKRYFFIVLFLAVYAHSMISGEMSSSSSSSKSKSSSSSSSSEDGTRLLFNEPGDTINNKIYFAFKKAGEEAEQGSLKIGIDAAFITDHAIFKTAISSLAEKGAEVDIVCGPNAYNNQAVKHLEKISEDNPSVKISQQPQHSKRVLIEYVDKETGESRSQVFEGSNNLSHAAKKNHEIMSYTKNDKNYYKQVKKSHDSQYDSPDEDKENESLRVFKVTPEKKRHVDSKKHNLVNNVVYRIDHAKKDDIVNIASMNFSNPEVFNAIEKACDRGVEANIVVNSSALNSKTSGDFERIKKAGANIYVYPESKNGIFHEKFCERISNPGTKDENSVIVIGSRNLSEDTEKDEFNHQAIFPHASNLSKQLGKHLKGLKKQHIVKPLTNKMLENALHKKEEKKKKNNYLNSPIHKKDKRKKIKKSSLLSNSSVQRSLTFDKKI